MAICLKVFPLVVLLGLEVLGISGWDICQDQEDNIFLAHPADCSKYVLCNQKTTASILSCPQGLHFNRRIGQCDFKNRARCELNEEINPLLETSDCSECNCCCCCSCCNGESGGCTPTDSTPTDSPPTDSPSTECTPDSTPESTPDSTPESTPDITPDSTPESTPDITPDSTPESTPDITPDSTPESTPDITPDSTPESTPESTPDVPATGPSGISCADPGVCAGQLDNTLHADTSSNGYIQCVCECPVYMECPGNLVFNATLQSCYWTEDACPDGLVYNATIGSCDWPTGSDVSNGNLNITCPNNSTICANETDGTLYPVNGVCNKFYKCNYGCAVEITCPNNLIYNVNDEICDWPQNYQCQWPYTPPSGPSAGPSGISCPSGGRCVGQSEGTFLPSIDSCSNYVVCQCECEVEMTCPDGLLFDSTSNVCNYASAVDCTE